MELVAAEVNACVMQWQLDYARTSRLGRFSPRSPEALIHLGTFFTDENKKLRKP